MKKTGLLLLIFGLIGLYASEKRAMTFEDMFQMKRISNGAISPDGTRALFQVKQADVKGNTSRKQIFMVDLQSQTMKAMTSGSANCGSPLWAPDGSFFLYSSGGQIYKKGFDGSAAHQITDQPEGAGGAILSPDGKQMVFASTVNTEEEKPYAHSGKLIDHLSYKQWNQWVFGTNSHLFQISVSSGKAEGVDITPGPFDTPPLDLGSAHDYDFSPDGTELAYVKNIEKMVAISTNNDIFLLNLKTGKEKQLTMGKGADASPHYSPDGKWLAFTSMERAGFEADRKVITLYNRKTGAFKALTAKGDHSAGGMIWLPDSSGLLYTAYYHGGKSIFRVNLRGKIEKLTEGTYDYGLSLDSKGGTLLFHRQKTTMPAELFTMNMKSGDVNQVTNLNGEILAQLEMNPWETFWFKGPNGDQVQGAMIKPPFFKEGKKYPMVFLIHGGPQGMWANNFHYRWNSQLFAAPGYVVVMVNPHGSKGYGQTFCDAVSKDWGGLPYEDLMKGLDVALEKYPFIDKEKIGAAGASYGGFMINWIAGHNNRFTAMVSHDGVYNMSSMYGATEELWFPEWEFGGNYYEYPELYEKWSPHRFAKNFKTPILVVHSEKDFRVPVNQGMELFTALQRMGVPSKWLYFPDEDHFVQKPLNAKMWWQTVHAWFETYLKN